MIDHCAADEAELQAEAVGSFLASLSPRCCCLFAFAARPHFARSGAAKVTHRAHRVDWQAKTDGLSRILHLPVIRLTLLAILPMRLSTCRHSPGAGQRLASRMMTLLLLHLTAVHIRIARFLRCAMLAAAGHCTTGMEHLPVRTWAPAVARATIAAILPCNPNIEE